MGGRGLTFQTPPTLFPPSVSGIHTLPTVQTRTAGVIPNTTLLPHTLPGTRPLPHLISELSGRLFLHLPRNHPRPPSQPPSYLGYFNSLSNAHCLLPLPARAPGARSLHPCTGCSFSPLPPTNSDLSSGFQTSPPPGTPFSPPRVRCYTCPIKPLFTQHGHFLFKCLHCLLDGSVWFIILVPEAHRDGNHEKIHKRF